MADKKTSEAQKKATQKQREHNPEQHKYNSYKTSARTFARHWATKDDMKDLIKIFQEENENAKERE